MAGSLVVGELSAPPAVRSGVRCAVATAADEAAIRRLLRGNPMRGAISLSFEREPDYFRGAQLGGAEEQTIVAYDEDQLVCTGRCTVRPGWINGQRRRVAYLGELRLDAMARGRISILRRGYAFFHALHPNSPGSFFYTSISADNQPARRLLERGLPGLPRYSFLTEFVTLVIPTRKSKARAEPDPAPATYGELAAFLNQDGQRHHLAVAWDEAHLLALAAHGLRREDFQFIRVDRHIVAAAALWDQRAFRQIVIRGYAPFLARARPVLNFFARACGRPALPDVNSVLAQAFVSPLAVAPGYDSALPVLLAALSHEAARRGLSFLTLGFAAADPRLAVVRRHVSARAYLSRLYRVDWPGESAEPKLDSRHFGPEVSFL